MHYLINEKGGRSKTLENHILERERIEKKEPPRKSSWKWILGADDDEKDKKSKEDKASDSSSKSKSSKLSKAPSEKTRLMETSSRRRCHPHRPERSRKKGDRAMTMLQNLRYQAPRSKD